jgi:hypothetical protein
MNEYLSLSTLQWCIKQLRHLEFDISQPASNPVMPHRTIYLQLRTALTTHLASGNLPELGLSVKPTGALNWQPPPLQTEGVQEGHLAGDGADDDVLEN